MTTLNLRFFFPSFAQAMTVNVVKIKQTTKYRYAVSNYLGMKKKSDQKTFWVKFLITSCKSPIQSLHNQII